jgi:hypothetical protein
MSREIALCRCCGHKFQVDKVMALRANSACANCGIRYNNDGAVECACGRHLVRKDEAVTYQDKQWRLSCFILKADRRMERIFAYMRSLEKDSEAYRKMRLKFIRMKNYLRSEPCVHCGYPLGNRFVRVDDGFRCKKCANGSNKESL